MSRFYYNKYDKKKTGILNTKHGNILTPNIVSCATRGSIRGLSTINIPENTQMILCNTFHLQDISKRVKSAEGLHKFLKWNKPIIMDSGGFQIFSMGHGTISDDIKISRDIKGEFLPKKNHIIKIDDSGCYFRSPINGDIKFLSPEISIQIQDDCKTDILISFDECTSSNCDYEYTKLSMKRSHDWELRSLKEFQRLKNDGILCGIIQGGIYKDLRDESIDFVNNNAFNAVTIGGCLGKTKEEMHDLVKYIVPKINPDYYVHLLGIGYLDDVFELAGLVDSFDCVYHTRLGRHGTAIVPYFLSNNNKLNLFNSCFKSDDLPIDSTCKCRICLNYTRNYLNYLLSINEIGGISAIIEHNIFAMNRIFEDIRSSLFGLSFIDLRIFWLGLR